MATSQNGWPAYSSGTHPDLVAIPHVAGRVRRGDVATIFTYLIDRFDREVESVAEAAGQPEDDWGWAARPIRGKTTDLSNHASGTAIDLNAPRHPLGKVGTFTTRQVAALRSILAALGGVVRWGGDYSGRKDEMHFEINANAQRVAQVAAAIRGGQLVSKPSGGIGSITIPNLPGAIAPITPEDDMANVPQAQWDEALLAIKQIRDTIGAQGGLNLPTNSTVLAHSRATVELLNAIPNRVWATTVDRGPAGRVTALQELADAKTNVLALVGREAAQTELIRQIAAGGPDVQVDYDRIDRSVRAAVADGVAEVVTAIEGGVDVNVTVSTPTTEKG